MTLTFSDVLIFVVLCACVPLQYVLVNNWGNNESNRSYFINKFFKRFSEFHDYFRDNFFPWMEWLDNTNQDRTGTTLVLDDEGQSPALEIQRFKEKVGFFAFSQEPRLLRHPSVNFRIGQVVQHKKWKYKGVIIGWDEKAHAPIEWLDQMHGKENPHWREMPNYSLLVDTRDRLTPQLTYVPQENLEVITNTQIIHPMIEPHFEDFDGTKYIPRPWLKLVYPQD